MEIEIVQLKYMPYRHQLHTHVYIYNYFLQKVTALHIV